MEDHRIAAARNGVSFRVPISATVAALRVFTDSLHDVTSTTNHGNIVDEFQYYCVEGGRHGGCGAWHCIPLLLASFGLCGRSRLARFASHVLRLVGNWQDDRQVKLHEKGARSLRTDKRSIDPVIAVVSMNIWLWRGLGGASADT